MYVTTFLIVGGLFAVATSVASSLSFLIGLGNGIENGSVHGLDDSVLGGRDFLIWSVASASVFHETCPDAFDDEHLDPCQTGGVCHGHDHGREPRAYDHHLDVSVGVL